MIIDTHTHVGSLAGRVYAADALSHYMDECNVRLALVSHTDFDVSGAALDEVDINMACLETCTPNPNLLPVYWARPGQVDSNARVFAGALRAEPFAAAIFTPARHGYEAHDLAKLGPYLEVLAELGRPALIHLDRASAASGQQIHTLATRWPKLPIVLLNALVNRGRTAVLEAVGHASRRGDASLYIEIGHASADEIARAIESVGIGRMLFGSNACPDGETHATRVRELLANLHDRLGADAVSQIVFSNPQRLFQLRGNGTS